MAGFDENAFWAAVLAQDREAMRRLAGTLPGVVLYISGDYGELEAFETRILSLEGECLREERA